MRRVFIKTLVELAEKDKRIILLTGDLGYMSIEPFSEKFPDRFFNVGIAEMNMVGLATGLAEAGFIPFIYSIVPFSVLRPYEFLRNGPIAHKLPVRIIGVGGGIEYSQDGISHYGLEDIGVMRIQPDITVIAPADYIQAGTALSKTWNLPGPIYYRLGKDEKNIVQGLDGCFDMGHIQIIREGHDILFITTGSITGEVIKASEILDTYDISSTVALVANIHPPPIEDLSDIISKAHLVITVESHYITGGIGSLTAEVIAENRLDCKLIRCGIKQMPNGISGSQDYLYRINGISADILANTALKAVNDVKITNSISNQDYLYRINGISADVLANTTLGTINDIKVTK